MIHTHLLMAAAALFCGSIVAAQSVPPAAPARAERPNPDINGPDANSDGLITRAEAQAAGTARFARMDANSDGRLDQADWEQVRQQRRAAMFVALDTDGNGAITRPEWEQAADQRAARMGERIAPRGENRPDGGRRMRGHGRPDGGVHGGREGGRGHMGARLDTNRDRIVTREEFMAAVMDRHGAIDGNRDGAVTAAERAAHRTADRAARPERAGNRR